MDRQRPAHARWWLGILGLVAVMEVLALVTKAGTDTLSESMWWLYGEQYSARWWFLGCLVAALLFWCPVHWLFPSVTGHHLAAVTVVMFGVACAGWALTR